MTKAHLSYPAPRMQFIILITEYDFQSLFVLNLTFLCIGEGQNIAFIWRRSSSTFVSPWFINAKSYLRVLYLEIFLWLIPAKIVRAEEL